MFNDKELRYIADAIDDKIEYLKDCFHRITCMSDEEITQEINMYKSILRKIQV
ncbi:MAG: hypothetical protein ACLVIH_17920 [Paraclostridium sordellii]|uniref:hypothetical protein n=1 Tax=Paraclostridium sordellii TaxID=1505 RepID=UPI0005DCE099|nr:hypothetical protein [Paeniclostridium sordellii]CEP50298.1 Uncharacterised protein [[Clostridium] sordellii] [Paeniclostridium sordellii]